MSAPLVGCICRAPLLSGGVAGALRGVAEVRCFSAIRSDIAGLLHSLRPDGVVVDSDDAAEGAEEFARESSAPVVHVSLREHRLRVLRNGVWTNEEGTAPDDVRNTLVGGIFARVGRR